MRRIQHTAEEIQKIENTFHPLDLNEYNVNTIYERCLFVKDGVNFYKVLNTSEEYAATNCQSVRLLMKQRGFDREDDFVDFNKERLRENQKSIAYLFGQLAKVHTQKDYDVLAEYSIYVNKYTGEKWTFSSNSLAKLFYLGSAVYLTGLFAKRNGKTCVYVCAPNIVKPTLSPQDPAFKAWWEEHKAEWDSKQLPEIR